MISRLGSLFGWLICSVVLFGTLAGCEDGQFASEKPEIVYQADSAQVLQARSANSVPKTYVLQPGDVVSVVVINNPELSKSVVVGPDGRIRYPLVGDVTARGRTLRQLESSLTTGLGQTIVAAQVSVSLSELRSYRIFVDGEVVQPGEFLTDGPVSVVQAIALAGGFTAYASRDDVVIYNPRRDSGQRIVFNYDLFLRTKNQPDLFLLPGDTVIVR